MSDTHEVPAHDITRLPKEELKAFVLGVVDGHVFTLDHLAPHEQNLGTSVFMPLMFGALDLPEEHMPPPLPDEPVSVLPPAPVGEPELVVVHPSRPEEPVPPEIPESVREDVKWGRLGPEALAAYSGILAEHALQLQVFSEVTLPEWEAGCREVEAAKLEKARLFSVRLNAFKDEVARIEAEHEVTLKAWESLKKAYNAEYSRRRVSYWRELGTVWEWMHKAGPRGINGHPMFMSCHLMHHEDWALARKAIHREQERRKTHDVLAETEGDLTP